VFQQSLVSLVKSSCSLFRSQDTGLQPKRRP